MYRIHIMTWVEFFTILSLSQLPLLDCCFQFSLGSYDIDRLRMLIYSFIAFFLYHRSSPSCRHFFLPLDTWHCLSRSFCFSIRDKEAASTARHPLPPYYPQCIR